VRRLTGIVGKELGEVFERSELRFGGIFEDREFLGGRIDVAETTTSGG
jgi:hypothetical protein